MKKFILFLFALPLLAQFQPVPSTNYPALEAVLNAKPAIQTGIVVPTMNCSTGKDIYVNTATGDLYWCTTPNIWTKYQQASNTIVQTGQPNAYTGGVLQDFSSAKIKFGVSTVTNLPAASGNQYVVYLVTNGTSATDCTVGGGSTLAVCASNGSAWVSVGGGGGGGGSGTVNSGLGGQLTYYSTSGAAVSGVTMGGDCTFSAPNITCNKTNGSTFATVATSGSAADITGTLSAARLPALTGDVTSSVGSAATTLAASGVTAGSCTNCNLTVDAKGRVTAQSNGTGGGGSVNAPTASIVGSNLHFFSNCNSTTPCYIPKGGGLFDEVTAANDIPVPGSGSGTVYVLWSSSGAVIGSPSGVSITGTGGGPLAIVSTQGYTNFYTAGKPAPTSIITKCDYAAGAWTSSSLKNYQLAATPSSPILAGGTGISIANDGQTQTASIDTGATSIGTGTANYVARWNGNSYTLSTGVLQDNGTVSGANCLASGGQTFAVCKNFAGTMALGITNTNAGGLGELQFTNDAGQGFGIGVGGSTSNQANRIYMYTDTGSFYGWMKNGWTFATNSFPGNPTVKIENDGGLQLVSFSQPTCDSGHSGTFFYVAGGTGVKDSVQVCAKDASNAYAWRTIY